MWLYLLKQIVKCKALMMLVAFLFFGITAMVLIFKIRTKVYYAKQLQEECGPKATLEMETARFALYANELDEASFNTLTVVFAVSVAAVIALGIWALDGDIGFNPHFYIGCIAIGLMVPTYYLLQSALHTKSSVEHIYDELRTNMPSTITAFPKDMVDAMVRRWYAAHPQERMSPMEVEAELGGYVEQAEADKAKFLEFLKYVHPAGDMHLVNRVETGGTNVAKTDAGKVRYFLETLGNLSNPTWFDDRAAKCCAPARRATPTDAGQ